MSLPYPHGRVRDPLSLPSGYLRNEVHIQQQGDSGRDAVGGLTTAWTDIYVAFAAIGTISSKEMYQSTQSAQFVGEATHLFTLRWPGELGLKAGMRVTFGPNQSRTAVIQAPPENVQQRNRVLKLICLEIDGSE